jgi:hypothetical protein
MLQSDGIVLTRGTDCLNNDEVSIVLASSTKLTIHLPLKKQKPQSKTTAADEFLLQPYATTFKSTDTVFERLFFRKIKKSFYGNLK